MVCRDDEEENESILNAFLKFLRSDSQARAPDVAFFLLWVATPLPWVSLGFA